MRRHALRLSALAAALAMTSTVLPADAAPARTPTIKVGTAKALSKPTWDIWNTAHISDGGRYMAVRRNNALYLSTQGRAKMVRVTKAAPGDSFDLSGNGRYVFFTPSRGSQTFHLVRWDRTTRKSSTVVRGAEHGPWAIDRSGEIVASTGWEGPLTVRTISTGSTQTVATVADLTDPSRAGWSDAYRAPSIALSPNGRYLAYAIDWRGEVILRDLTSRTSTTLVRTGTDASVWTPMGVSDNGRVVMTRQNDDGRTSPTLRIFDLRTRASTQVRTPVKGALPSVLSGDTTTAVIRRESHSHGRATIREWLWTIGSPKARVLSATTKSGPWRLDGYMWDLDATGRHGAYLEGGWNRTAGGEKARPVRWRR